MRPAVRSDGGDILGLARSFATTFQVRDSAFNQTFVRLIDDPDARLIVGGKESNRVDGYLLGFVYPTFFANGLVAWIEEITVRDDARRLGLGSALVEDFERWASNRGAGLVALATRQAMNFYAALGYKESALYFRKLL